MQNTLVMTFGTADGNSVNLRIPRARTNLSAASVQMAMNQLIAAAGLHATRGAINSAQRAHLQRVVTTDIDLA